MLPFWQFLRFRLIVLMFGNNLILMPLNQKSNEIDNIRSPRHLLISRLDRKMVKNKLVWQERVV